MFLNYLYKEKLAEKIYFKGGTCLHLFYNSPRFSEDLDFSTTLSEKKIKNFLKEIIKKFQIEVPTSSLSFVYRRENSLRFKLKYESKFLKFPQTIRLDFSLEKIFLEPNTLSLKTKFPVNQSVPIPRQFIIRYSSQRGDDIGEVKVFHFVHLGVEGTIAYPVGCSAEEIQFRSFSERSPAGKAERHRKRFLEVPVLPVVEVKSGKFDVIRIEEVHSAR